jgi:hypothetical protein
MSPESLRGAFRVGVFITMVSVIMVVSQPRESGEFVISLCSVFIGLAIIGVVWLVLRMSK